MKSYREMSKKEKEFIKNKIKEAYPEENIDLEDIEVSEKDEKIEFQFAGFKASMPRPDKKTNNSICLMFAGGALAIAGFIVAKKY